jgi:hypothetical protein
MNKLTIEYEMNTIKSFIFSLSIDFINAFYALRALSKVDQELRKKYKKKIDSICYSTNITQLDVTKAAFKLTEYLINSKLNHLHATNHCLQYLHIIKHLTIRYSLLRSDELIVLISFNFDPNFDLDQYQDKHVFENTIDVRITNNSKRRSYENFIFKLYENMID